MSQERNDDGLPMNFYEGIKSLEICDRKCNSVISCGKLEICHQYLFSGKCLFEKYEDESCRFGHDLKTKHNLEILKRKGLEELKICDLRSRLILMKRNISCIPICDKYNSNEPHEDCAALDICYKYLYEKCEEKSCHLSHDLSEDRCALILDHYGISESDHESLLKDIRKTRNRPFVDVPRLLLEYTDVKELGSGGFGEVYKAKHILDKQFYAVKCILVDVNSDPDESQNSGTYEEPQDIETALREVQMLSSLNHENIVKYNTAWLDKPVNLPGGPYFEADINPVPGHKCLYIQMELCQTETLESVVYSSEKFDKEPQYILYQMVKAIDYLHSKSVMHRDLKPNNVFFEKDSNKVKVGDFGLAKICSKEPNNQQKHTDRSGTMMYTSPEMENQKPYTELTDVYSLGIIAVLMFYPLSTKYEWVKVNKTTRETSQPPEEIKASEKMREMIRRMLADESDRISARELLQELDEVANENQ